MSNFILEITLNSDLECVDCPCCKLDYNEYTAYCEACIIKSNVLMVKTRKSSCGHDWPYPVRPDWCPLKEIK